MPASPPVHSLSGKNELTLVPFELKNLIKDESAAAALKELQGELDRQRQATGAK